MFAGLSELLGPLFSRGISSIAGPVLSGAQSLLEKYAPGLVSTVSNVIDKFDPDTLTKAGNAISNAGFSKLGNIVSRGAVVARKVKSGATKAREFLGRVKNTLPRPEYNYEDEEPPSKRMLTGTYKMPFLRES